MKIIFWCIRTVLYHQNIGIMLWCERSYIRLVKRSCQKNLEIILFFNICVWWAWFSSTIFPAPPYTFCTSFMCTYWVIFIFKVFTNISSVARWIQSGKPIHVYLPCLRMKSHLFDYPRVAYFCKFGYPWCLSSVQRLMDSQGHDATIFPAVSPTWSHHQSESNSLAE